MVLAFHGGRTGRIEGHGADQPAGDARGMAQQLAVVAPST